MTDNKFENWIEQLVSWEIHLNQSQLGEELVLKPNPDWIDQIENYNVESSEDVEEYLTNETDIEEATW